MSAAPAPKPAKAKLAPGWQKRVVQVKMDVEAQANLMTKRGVKHKEVSGALLKAEVRLEK